MILDHNTWSDRVRFEDENRTVLAGIDSEACQQSVCFIPHPTTLVTHYAPAPQAHLCAIGMQFSNLQKA